MQTVSNKYKQSMLNPLRNRGYIRVYFGIINQKAQNNLSLSKENLFAYFSTPQKTLYGEVPEKIYATSEEDFSSLDGGMYFLPEKESGYELYNNGIVTESIAGSIIFDFGEFSGLEIKGLTIDFGTSYPTEFSVETDNGTFFYKNSQREFQTEDAFGEVSYIKITAVKMLNGENRLRIYQFSTGVVKLYTNKEIKSFSQTEYVSSISETIPSLDMTLTLDNTNMYFNPDDDDSALAYLEPGQQLSVSVGYDTSGNGDIEWITPTTAYLKNWKADNTSATFTATDKFDIMDGTYKKGKYYSDGISIYDLAVDVLKDAGIEKEEYYIDPYLSEILIKNPIPEVMHKEALQMLANAGRCALFVGRNNKIYLKSNFVPDIYPSCNGETEYSAIENILDTKPKEAYAISSSGFSSIDGSMFFLSDSGDYINTGYISDVVCDENGDFERNPIITLELEAGFPVFSLYIRFREVAPQEFVIKNYLQEELVEQIKVQNPSLEYTRKEQFQMFDKMEIVFTKGQPNTRITVDAISMSDIITDYYVTKKDIINQPNLTRLKKTKSIRVVKNNYRILGEQKELAAEEFVIASEKQEIEVSFSNASIPKEAVVESHSSAVAEIMDFSSYYAKIKVSGIPIGETAKIVVVGNEYAVDKKEYVAQYNQNGTDVAWDNPIISDEKMAEDVADWLSNYYLSNVEYDIKWRGDPRVDANDLFYLDLENGSRPMIRAHSNSMSYNGAFSGSMKARKVVI